MGGVDVSGQRRKYYGVSRSSKKWWKFIFHFVLNVCLVNCFILYDLTNHPPSTAHGNRQLTFRRNLVRQLIGTFTPRKRTGRKRSSLIGTALPNLFHTLQKVSGCAKVCALCTEKKKKAPSGRGKQTTYKCKQCGLPLCRVGCFFWIPQAVKCGGGKLGKYVITCINLLRIRRKKSYHTVFFSLLWFFFLEGDLFLV